MYDSVIISSPEFENLEPLDISPFISKCDIKVCYTGQNRNRSFISKETAQKMAKTIRGVPIVGYYREDKGDFSDHGEKITIDQDGFRVDCLTRPYGFVSPDAKVWFQKYRETNDMGQEVEREYLMTQGFLWTGQFKEANEILKSGKGQSMELDDDTTSGSWQTDVPSNIDFFVIIDANISKLCALGDDVEPCFEGASILPAQFSMDGVQTQIPVPAHFTIDDDFKQTLFSMVEDLKIALEGGQKMKENELFSKPTEENNIGIETETTVETTKTTEFEKKDEDKDKSNDDISDSTEDEKDKDDEDKKKYALLEKKYNELETQYSALKTEFDSLVQFKNSVETEKKQALIDSFYMLSNEDKKDVIENITKYSYDDIEAKLSVICVRKKVNFNLEQEATEKKESVITYQLDDTVKDSSLPAWLMGAKKIKDEFND